MTQQFDVVIIGGGMVGGLLAAALASDALSKSKPLSVCVVESQVPAEFIPGDQPEYDLRVSALSLASQNMLINVGAWDGVLARRACPYSRLSVWDGEQNGRTDFNADDLNIKQLGHIVENRVIQLALLERLSELPNVTLLCPASLVRYSVLSDCIEITLSDSQTLTAKLLVGADGAGSYVRKSAGISIDKTPYDQHALVASVKTSLPQQNITWQRFVPAGPQAMLPLCGQRASLVWYDSQQNCEQRLALSDEAFLEAVAAAFPQELGRLDSICGRSAFPIARAHAQTYVQQRIALVGDAAHTVHPLAGQGVNLGFMDAAALAEQLVQAHSKQRDIGVHKLLRRYERSRRFDNQIMISALDSIFHAFKPQPLLVRQARSLSLNAVNAISPLKSLLMRQATGVGSDLPSLAFARNNA